MIAARTSFKKPEVAARAAVVPRVEPSRRASIAALVAAPALFAAKPSRAAYGDQANVFGRPTNTSGYIPYSGEGFKMLIPSKWNPAKEEELRGTILNYQDNGDTLNNICVAKQPTGKASIEDYGSSSEFLSMLQNMGVFGKQAYSGSSRSEGGFLDGRYAAASLLDQEQVADKSGNKYYTYQILSRSADGNEGGRHQLVKATVNDGNLWILKIVIGDKRWFKGAKKEALGSFESFQIV